ncbi:hypothetical protein BUL40_09855 [Croceivirga radicis]|uniref:Uncharacterized protein n=1 Tax=Croceivirga radicis TaxID=1929488 RepID=A0A1V6LRN5_9FLAO|nr:hypothetical protein [Croceivirga radicis]OQD42808.1 hypothetical protein BUL40_09855 [Croceivirga radicis]
MTNFFILSSLILVSCNNSLDVSSLISKDLYLSELKGNVKKCEISETHYNNGNTFTISEVISFNEEGHIVSKIRKSSLESSEHNYQNHYSNKLRDSTSIFDSNNKIIQKYIYSYGVDNKLVSILNIDYENQLTDSIKMKYFDNSISLISPRMNKEMSFDNESSLIMVKNKINNQSVSLIYSEDKSKSEKETNGFKEINSYTYDGNVNWIKKETKFNVKTDNKIEYNRNIQYY